MFTLKGLLAAVVAGLGFLAVQMGGSFGDTQQANAYYPNASLPTLFQPMRH